MLAHQRAERLQRDAAFRLRSKFHSQSVRHQRTPESSSSYSPLAKSAMITELMDKHKEKPTEAVAQQAIAQIRSFRIPTIEEDPMFRASRQILRAVHYFGLSSEQTCADLIEMHCLHTYSLDGNAMGGLFNLLARMPIRGLAEIVPRLTPRVDMIAEDLTVRECASVLNALAKSNQVSRSASTVKAMCAMIKRFSTDEVNPRIICDNIFTVAKCDQLQGRVLLGMFEKKLKDLLSAGGTEDIKLLCDLVRAVTTAGGASRRLLNCICRTAADRALQLSPEDAANVMHCMHVTSHRCETILRRLASIQLTQEESQTPETVALSLAALAHFYIFDHELYLGLVRAVANNVDGEQAASILRSCGRVRQHQKWVCDLVLPRFVRNVQRQTTRALSAVLLFVAEGKLADTLLSEAKVIVSEISRRGDVSGRDDVLRAVLALRQYSKAPSLLEQVELLAEKV